MPTTALLPAERIAEAVARAKREILDDIAAGNVPADVATFSALHDHTDANVYGGLCDEGPDPDAEHVLLWDVDDANRVQDAVNLWLTEGRPQPETEEGERFLDQNSSFAMGLVAEEDLDAVDEFAEHHCGGMFVLIRPLHSEGEGRWFVKAHDSWGPPEDGLIVVHVYDADNDGSEAYEDAEVCTFFSTGPAALAAFRAAEVPTP